MCYVAVKATGLPTLGSPELGERGNQFYACMDRE